MAMERHPSDLEVTRQARQTISVLEPAAVKWVKGIYDIFIYLRQHNIAHKFNRNITSYFTCYVNKWQFNFGVIAAKNLHLYR
jgi:hypothetical protein